LQLFFLFFVFFSFAHNRRDIGQGTKKKKLPGVFFQTPSGHWAINAQWDSVRMSAAKKKKRELYCQGPRLQKRIAMSRPRAEASYRLKKRASDAKASYRLKKRVSASPDRLQHKTSPGPIWPLSIGHSSM